jgi:hypothetical protein
MNERAAVQVVIHPLLTVLLYLHARGVTHRWGTPGGWGGAGAGLGQGGVLGGALDPLKEQGQVAWVWEPFMRPLMTAEAQSQCSLPRSQPLLGRTRTWGRGVTVAHSGHREP